MNHALHYPDLLIIAAFLSVTLYLGLRYARKKQSTQSYFLAKGKVPAWAIGMSLLSSMISSVTFLAYPGEGYSSNWILLVQGLMVPVVLVGIIWFIVPLYRKVIGLSTYEYFEKRFGSFVRYYSSLAFVLRQFSAMGTIFFLLALALSNMIGCNTMLMITVIGSVDYGIPQHNYLDLFTSSSYAQKNPKQEYKREAFELFSAMLDRIKFDTVTTVSKIQIRSQEEIEREERHHDEERP